MSVTSATRSGIIVNACERILIQWWGFSHFQTSEEFWTLSRFHAQQIVSMYRITPPRVVSNLGLMKYTIHGQSEQPFLNQQQLIHVNLKLFWMLCRVASVVGSSTSYLDKKHVKEILYCPSDAVRYRPSLQSLFRKRNICLLVVFHKWKPALFIVYVLTCFMHIYSLSFKKGCSCDPWSCMIHVS